MQKDRIVSLAQASCIRNVVLLQLCLAGTLSGLLNAISVHEAWATKHAAAHLLKDLDAANAVIEEMPQSAIAGSTETRSLPNL